MPATKSIPVTITPEAATSVAEWKRQRELETMLAYAQQTVSGLHAIHVLLAPEYDSGLEPRVVIELWKDPPADDAYDPTDWNISGWKVDNFPPEVNERFLIMAMFGTPHEG